MAKSSIASIIILPMVLGGCSGDSDAVLSANQLEVFLGEGSVTVSWIPPTTFSDGTPLSPSQLQAFRLYLGEDEENMQKIIDIDPNENMSSYQVRYNANAIERNFTYFVAMSTVTSGGLESELSEAVSFNAQ